MREFIINQNDAGQRVDKFLTKAVPKLPKNLLYKYLRLKRIKLNGKRCEISTRLSCGDVMQLYINDEFFEGEVADRPAFLSAPTSLNIIYEDENIILCEKKCGLVVHEDESGSTDTLINRIQHYLYEKGEYRPEEELSFAPALCNRIDRNTGGIVICAKNAESLRVLNQKVKDRELEKLYLCVTVGIPKEKSARLTAYHQKDEATKTVRVSDKKFEGSRTMITSYRVLAENKADDLALLEGIDHFLRQIVVLVQNGVGVRACRHDLLLAGAVGIHQCQLRDIGQCDLLLLDRRKDMIANYHFHFLPLLFS